MRSSISGRAAIVPEEYPDAYAVVRALLTDRGAAGCQLATEHSERILLRHMQAKATPSSTLAEEAEHHGIAPLIAPAIEALSRKRPDLVDDAVHWTFVALTSRHRAAAAAREQCIEALLEAFDTAGIRPFLLKGGGLARRIYSPELRPMLDIDVLIEPQHTERAIAIARSLGYTFASGYASRFSGRLHHLPEATMDRAGFRMSLEIHLDALSRDQPERLTLATLS